MPVISLVLLWGPGVPARKRSSIFGLGYSEKAPLCSAHPQQSCKFPRSYMLSRVAHEFKVGASRGELRSKCLLTRRDHADRTLHAHQLMSRLLSRDRSPTGPRSTDWCQELLCRRTNRCSEYRLAFP